VTESVPEYYTVKRTCYKYECRQEMCDSYRCECVPVCKERVVCCTKKVPCYRTEHRKVCKTVTCYEDRTCYKTCYHTVQETCVRKHLVRCGHWECRETCHCSHGWGHHNDCCDPCHQPCCTVRTHRVWVHCPEYEDRCHTVCRRVCEQVPYCVKVPVCHTVWEDVCVQVCTYQCVTEQRVEKYTCYETVKVPCKVCRTVRVCVPYEECVTCCRMVCRQKCIQVPVCDNCCPSCGHGHGLFGRHHHNDCCDPCGH
jgi:hypothetical protein